MRISDWSSDVCSSDLGAGGTAFFGRPGRAFRPASRSIVPRAGDGGGRRALAARGCRRSRSGDRKSVVKGKRGYVRLDLGSGSLFKKHNPHKIKLTIHVHHIMFTHIQHKTILTT